MSTFPAFILPEGFQLRITLLSDIWYLRLTREDVSQIRRISAIEFETVVLSPESYLATVLEKMVTEIEMQ